MAVSTDPVLLHAGGGPAAMAMVSTVDVALQCWQCGQYHGVWLQLTFIAVMFANEMFDILPTFHGCGRRCHARAPLPKLIGTAVWESVISRYETSEMFPPSFVEMPMPAFPASLQVTFSNETS